MQLESQITLYDLDSFQVLCKPIYLAFIPQKICHSRDLGMIGWCAAGQVLPHEEKVLL